MQRQTFSAAERQQLFDRAGIDDAANTIEAAALLGRTPQCLRRWAAYGTGPIKPIRVSGRLRWPLSEIRRVVTGGQ